MSDLPGRRVVTFHADGTWILQQTQPLAAPRTGYWHVDGSELVTVLHGSKWVQRDSPFRYAAVKIFDRQMIKNLTDRTRIESIDANVIHFRGVKHDFEFIRIDPGRRDTSKRVP